MVTLIRQEGAVAVQLGLQLGLVLGLLLDVRLDLWPTLLN